MYIIKYCPYVFERFLGFGSHEIPTVMYMQKEASIPIHSEDNSYLIRWYAIDCLAPMCVNYLTSEQVKSDASLMTAEIFSATRYLAERTWQENIDRSIGSRKWLNHYALQLRDGFDSLTMGVLRDTDKVWHLDDIFSRSSVLISSCWPTIENY